MSKEASWRIENAGRVLSFASALFEREVLRTVQQGEFAWVTAVQLALFRNLDLEGTHLTELAARGRVSKQSMQELVDKAERLGVVARRPDPRDRRIKIVAFTPAGLRMLDRFRDGVAEAERRMAESLGEDFLHDLKARLTAYVDASEPFRSLAIADRPRSGRPAPQVNAPQVGRAKPTPHASAARKPRPGSARS